MTCACLRMHTPSLLLHSLLICLSICFRQYLLDACSNDPVYSRDHLLRFQQNMLDKLK